jgi:NAD(P)H-dependent FMN reductase
MRIVGLSGSLRRSSLNTALLRAAGQLLPEGASLELADIRDVPLYDGDVEAAGFPAAVRRVQDQVAAAYALLIATPEYNHALPGVLKNALDWMSRPTAQEQARVFLHRPVAILGASPGPFGTARAQPMLLPVLRALRTRVFFDAAPYYLSTANKALDAEDQFIDPAQRDKLAGFLREFVAFAARS